MASDFLLIISMMFLNLSFLRRPQNLVHSFKVWTLLGRLRQILAAFSDYISFKECWSQNLGKKMPSKSEFCKTELSVWIVWYTLISAQPGLTTLLGQLPDQTQSLHSLLLSLESQAQILLDKIGKSSANGSVPKSGKASSDKVTEKTTDDRLARYILFYFPLVKLVARNYFLQSETEVVIRCLIVVFASNSANYYI